MPAPKYTSRQILYRVKKVIRQMTSVLPPLSRFRLGGRPGHNKPGFGFSAAKRARLVTKLNVEFEAEGVELEPTALGADTTVGGTRDKVWEKLPKRFKAQ